METLNNIVLIGIFLSSLGNLIIEVNETKTTRYVIIAKFLFALMATGSILAVVRPQMGYYVILNLAFLIGLVIRIIRSINRNK